MLINLVIFLFCALMIWAAISDFRYYILSNKLCLCVTFLYLVFLVVLYENNSLPDFKYIAWSVGISLGFFAILIGLFAYGYIGGGDVKLIPAVMLWAGPAFALQFLLITMICGGLLAILIISFQYLKKYLTEDKSSENINLSMSKSSQSKNEENKIPYGIGISAGGLFVAFKLFQALH